MQDDNRIGNELIFQTWEDYRSWCISQGRPDPGHPDSIRAGYPIAILRKKDKDATNKDAS